MSESKINSMTGFARQEGEFETSKILRQFSCEVRSVNGKNLDVKTRLPHGYELISQDIRKIASKYLSRGNIQISFNISHKTQEPEVSINKKLLDELFKASIDYYKENDEMLNKPSVENLFLVKGVVEQQEVTEEKQELAQLYEKLLQTAQKAIEKLFKYRQEEGEKTQKMLSDCIDNIENITLKAEKTASFIPQNIKDKVSKQIKELLDTDFNISEERLAQEASFYVLKADVREETDRLKAHIQTAREILEKGGVCGRKLDFLCQEFNREANTLCSKSTENELTKLGMELKTNIDQLREQVQNVE
jgi:uncharacterized protein (TIGR00255 family)